MFVCFYYGARAFARRGLPMDGRGLASAGCGGRLAGAFPGQWPLSLAIPVLCHQVEDQRAEIEELKLQVAALESAAENPSGRDKSIYQGGTSLNFKK